MIEWLVGSYIVGKLIAQPNWQTCGNCGRTVNINGVGGGIHYCA